MDNQILVLPSAPMIATELVEISITSGASVIAIPDQPQLRNQGDEIIIIKAVRLITSKVLANGVTIAGANMPLSDLQNAVLVLYAEGWEKGHYIPLLTLNDVADSDSTAATTIPFVQNPVQFADWKNVDWNKSKIQYCNGQTASISGVLMLQVQYQKFLRQANGTFIEKY